MNKMLKAMSAASGAHDGDDASAHLTKDASGNAMYDFRDIGGGQPKPTPVAQAAAVQVLAPVAGGAPPTPRAELTVKVAQQAQQTLPASSQPDDAPPMPDFGIVEPVKTRKAGGTARSLAVAKAVARVSVAPPNQADDDDDEEATAKEVPDQQSHLIVWPPEPVAAAAPQAKAKVVEVALGRAASAAPDPTAAALASGLASMRQNLDTLLGEANTMLHAHRVDPAPTAAPARAIAAGGVAGAEILERLQAIEDENAKLRGEEAAQGSRLEAVEEKEQKEGAELKTVGQENAKLRHEMEASQSAAFLQNKKAFKTFFHKKEKLRRH